MRVHGQKIEELNYSLLDSAKKFIPFFINF